MARKTERVTIEAEGRDKGKTFILTEMDSWSAVRWCAKAMLALTQSGVDTQAVGLSKAAEGGPEKIAALGVTLFAFIPPAVALPLLDEARACVSYRLPLKDDSATSSQEIADGPRCQVEEPATWKILLQRLFLLHLGFSEAGDAPKLRPTEPEPQQALPFDANLIADAPLCSECGSIMTRNGSCYKCENCGGTSGCS